MNFVRLTLEESLKRSEEQRIKRWDKADKENHLTGPEYHLVCKILKDLLKYKLQNEKEKKPQLQFIHLMSKHDLEHITAKMERRMDMFDGGAHRNTGCGCGC